MEKPQSTSQWWEEKLEEHKGLSAMRRRNGCRFPSGVLLAIAIVTITSTPGNPETLKPRVKVFVDGILINFVDVQPLIKSGRVLVPLRGVFQFLRATVTWDAESRMVLVKRGDTAITLVIDEPDALVDGRPTPIDVPPFILDRRTIVPLRFVSQALGAQVYWDPTSATVKITTPKPPGSITPLSKPPANFSVRVDGNLFKFDAQPKFMTGFFTVSWNPTNSTLQITEVPNAEQMRITARQTKIYQGLLWVALIELAVLVVQVVVLAKTFITARDTFWTTERSHIGVRNLRIGRWDGGKMFLRLDIRNHGKSPGWVTRMHLQAQTHTDRNLERQGMPDYAGQGRTTGGIIAAGESVYQEVEDEPGERKLEISESDRELVYSRDIYLFVHGFVDYRDIHNRSHRSCFGYRLIADAPEDRPQFAVIGNDAYWRYT